MSNFPNFNCGHMDYTPGRISIGADGEANIFVKRLFELQQSRLLDWKRF